MFFLAMLLLNIFILLVFPVLPFLTGYMIALYLKCLRYWKQMKGEFTQESWNEVRKQIAWLFKIHGLLWHGYEIQNSENIPSDGPALIIFYHGTVPTDCFYLLADTLLTKGRTFSLITERLMFKVPGLDAWHACFDAHAGSIDHCVDKLRKGNLVVIYPGGTREALYGDDDYSLMWAARIGYAKVAVKAKVPIIPVFTTNCREAYPTLSCTKLLVHYIYEKTKIPIRIIFGCFPVKMTTVVGNPILYDPACSAEELADKVSKSMNELISVHQQIPGSITRGLKERIQSLVKLKSS